jgi:hypothetical protein
MFNAATRQYFNLSHAFRFVGPELLAKESVLLDPYLASIFSGDDCSRAKYRSKRFLPQWFSVCGGINLVRKIPIRKVFALQAKYRTDPVTAKRDYLVVLATCNANVNTLVERGADQGLMAFASSLFAALYPSIEEELAAISVIIPLFKELDTARRTGKTETARADADALCGGYDEDELMQINIALYQLARKVPPGVWAEYDGRLDALAARIETNLNSQADPDLPRDFLDAYQAFMELYGNDGKDQMFVSSSRNCDNPELLLAKLRSNAGLEIRDPSVTQAQKLAQRREVRTWP